MIEPRTNSNRGPRIKGRIFCRLPVERSSRTTTSSPRASRASARCDPMNPAPPVMRVFMEVSSYASETCEFAAKCLDYVDMEVCEAPALDPSDGEAMIAAFLALPSAPPSRSHGLDDPDKAVQFRLLLEVARRGTCAGSHHRQTAERRHRLTHRLCHGLGTIRVG